MLVARAHAADMLYTSVGDVSVPRGPYAMKITKVFLASSSELKEDRQEFENLVNSQNKDWVRRDAGAYLDLEHWEDFFDAMSQTRLQDQYNVAVRESDIFVMLFATKVGKYTEEEFETAFGQFKATNKPFIFTYFKNTQVDVATASESDLMSLWAFRKKLAALGHFPTVYKDVGDLKYHFDQQLDKLVASGFIELTVGPGLAAARAPQPPAPAMPYLAYGSWTLRNAVDDIGNDWSNSVLKFSSQQPADVGLALRGTFTWRLSDDLVGTEEVAGYYIAATRQLVFEGESVTDSDRLAVGSYSAYLSADERELSDGRWGSSAQAREPGRPGHWEASR